jgi:hypothetical protein
MRKRKVLFLGRPYTLAASVVLLFIAFVSNGMAAWQPAIDGPTEVRAGELVVLSVEFNENATPKSLAWRVTPPELVDGKYRVCDDGRTLVFASREVGCYHFVLAASDGETLQMVTHTLLNIDDTPKPIPLPEPEPSPKPPREFQALTDWAAQRTTSLITSEHFVREKAALVESLTEIMTRIHHGEIATPERARIEMRVLTRKKLDAVSRRSTATWLAWETELARQLTQLEREGKLETLEQVRLAFDAIADGLLTCEQPPKSPPAQQRGR